MIDPTTMRNVLHFILEAKGETLVVYYKESDEPFILTVGYIDTSTKDMVGVLSGKEKIEELIEIEFAAIIMEKFRKISNIAPVMLSLLKIMGAKTMMYTVEL